MNNMEKAIDKIKDNITKLLKRIDKSGESAKKISSACNLINNSWSGSDLAGHAKFFYGDFDTPPHNKRFSIEWGLIHGTPDGWYKKSNEEVIQKIKNEAGTSPKNLDKDADYVTDEFDKLRKQTIILISSISREAATEIEKFNLQTKIDIFNKYWNRKIITRDSEAIYSGRQVPIHKYYDATASFMRGATEQLNEFLYLIDKTVAQNKSTGQKIKSRGEGRESVSSVDKNVRLGRINISKDVKNYIDVDRLKELRDNQNKNFDLIKLIKLCEELNRNYQMECYFSCAMLLRAITDHIPPLFNQESFNGVANNYKGSKSFKKSMNNLQNSLRNISDAHLHEQIRDKETLPNAGQVDFSSDLDILLGEICRLLK